MKNKLKLISLILTVATVFTLLVGCKNNKNNDIIILFTNDVHCGIDENIGLPLTKNTVRVLRNTPRWSTAVMPYKETLSELYPTVNL